MRAETLRALGCGLLLLGCSAGPLSALRFQNHVPVWAVADRTPIAKPKERKNFALSADFDAQIRRPALVALELPPPHPALNVNSLDEVADSSWFENRIGVRALPAERLEEGPNGVGIDMSAPWLVKHADDQAPPRFLIEDARGDRYFIKFDKPAEPELETSAEVVVQRLLWAAGYNVPENELVLFQRSQLRVAGDGERELVGGKVLPLREADLDAMLERVARDRDSQRFRAVASKFVAGKPIGGYPMSGVRADDPNDLVPHQHRRDVRGQKLLFAWLGQTDVKEDNTLDTWLPLARDATRGSVTHYLIDFGKSLGVWGRPGQHEHDGFSSHFDYGYTFRSLVAFGLWQRPWEDVRWPALRGVGRFEVARFDPDLYAPANSYTPFLYADAADAYWSAKIIARFRPEHVRAAVRAGRYSDPRSSAYLIATLLARQRKVLAAVLPRHTALEELEIEAAGEGGDRLCARDLNVGYGFVPEWSARYLLTAYDYEGRALGDPRELRPLPDGVLCTGQLPHGKSHDGYTLLLLRAFRGATELAPVVVHVARDPRTAAPRVIGVERRAG